MAAKMERRHFQLIAHTLGEAYPVGSPYGDDNVDKAKRAYWEWLVLFFGEKLRETNPAFDFDRFVTAAHGNVES